MSAVLRDVYGHVSTLVLYNSATLTNATEGTILDVSEYNGVAIARLSLTEAASTPVADKLDITIHNVASDSDTLDSDNRIVTFTQIVGLNGSELAHNESKALNLNLIPVLTAAEKVTRASNNVDTVKKYLQVLITNTSAWADSPLHIDLLVAGHRQLPRNAL